MNTNDAHPFRHTETTVLMGLAQAGESAAIIGISGVGKSNLFNHLLEPATQSAYLGDAAADYIFVRVNFHYAADFTARSIYSLILEQFELLGDRASALGLTAEQITQIEQHHEALLAAKGDNLKVQRYFKKAVRTLLGPSSKRKLVFLLDQFGEVYQTAEPRLFANLRGLREDYKYRLAFFIFTRQPLNHLVPDDHAREEFSELLASNTLGLKPYNRSDTHSALNRIAKRTGATISIDLAEKIFKLSGGHSGLLRDTYMLNSQNVIDLSLSNEKIIADLLELDSVQSEGQKIWQSLSVEEQRILAYIAHDINTEINDPHIVQRLQTKGVLSDKQSIFSPIMAAYVHQQKAVWEQPLYYDRQARRVFVYGKPIDKALTPTELHIFSLLYDRLGEPVSNKEITDAVWPGIDADQHLKTNIYRLRRKIEPNSREPRFLVTVQGYGYQLDDS